MQAIAHVPFAAAPTRRLTRFSAGEVGTMTLPGAMPPVPVTVELARGYRHPVVIAGPPSDNASNADVVVRVLGVVGDDDDVDARRRLQLQLQGLPGTIADQKGSEERVSYAVFDAGPGRLADGTRLEAGLIDTNATVPQGGFAQVRFAVPFAARPVVMAQVNSYNDPDWVKTRLRNVTAEGFEVAMEEQQTGILGNPPHRRETLGWLAIEPAQGEWSHHPYLAAEAPVDSRGRRLSWDLQAKAGENIHLLAGLASYRDRDPAYVRYRELGPGGATVRIQEDRAYDRETEHQAETLSYVAIVGDGVLEIEPLIVTAGEIGQISDLDHNLQTRNLNRPYTDPVRFALPPSFNGAAPCVVRLSESGDSEITLQIQEGPRQDGDHTMETVSYLVVEIGDWRLSPGGPRFEAGHLETDRTVGPGVTNQWAQVEFAHHFLSPPVVISQAQTKNGQAFVKTRMRNITADGFEVALEEGDGSTAKHPTEAVGWFAIEPAEATWPSPSQGRLPYSAGTTAESVDHQWSQIDFGTDLGKQPRFLASLASYKGGDPAELRYRSLTSTQIEIKVEEDWPDNPPHHNPEAVTFLAFGGDGDLQATPYVP